jgi:nitroreductase
MKLLTLPVSEHLLDIGVEELHKQSIEWLNKINFWVDEMDFFYRLVADKKKTIVPIAVQNSIWHVEKKLLKLSGGEIDEILTMVKKHEYELDMIMLNKINDEETFREFHIELNVKIKTFEKHYIHLKKEVFELIEQISKGEVQINDVTKNIFERRSVRKYQNKPVSKTIIKKIAECGTMAPSATNKQPWKFYVLTQSEMIHEFSKEIVKAAMRESSKSVLGLFDFPNSEEQMKVSDMVFYHAPVVVFITSPCDDEWADLDIGMCAQNMMLAAHSFGLESCPIGFAKYVEQSSVYSKLKIPENERVNLAIIFGYGDELAVFHERKKGNIFFID